MVNKTTLTASLAALLGMAPVLAQADAPVVELEENKVLSSEDHLVVKGKALGKVGPQNVPQMDEVLSVHYSGKVVDGELQIAGFTAPGVWGLTGEGHIQATDFVSDLGVSLRRSLDAHSPTRIFHEPDTNTYLQFERSTDGVGMETVTVSGNFADNEGAFSGAFGLSQAYGTDVALTSLTGLTNLFAAGKDAKPVIVRDFNLDKSAIGTGNITEQEVAVLPLGGVVAPGMDARLSNGLVLYNNFVGERQTDDDVRSALEGSVGFDVIDVLPGLYSSDLAESNQDLEVFIDDPNGDRKVTVWTSHDGSGQPIWEPGIDVTAGLEPDGPQLIVDSINDQAFGTAPNAMAYAVPEGWVRVDLDLSSRSKELYLADIIAEGTLGEYFSVGEQGPWMQSVRERAQGNDAYLGLKDRVGKVSDDQTGSHGLLDRWGSLGPLITEVNRLQANLPVEGTDANNRDLRDIVLDRGFVYLPTKDVVESYALGTVDDASTEDGSSAVQDARRGTVIPGSLVVESDTKYQSGKITNGDVADGGNNSPFKTFLLFAGLGLAYGLGRRERQSYENSDAPFVVPEFGSANDLISNYTSLTGRLSLVGGSEDDTQEVFTFDREDLISTKVNLPAVIDPSTLKEEYAPSVFVDQTVTQRSGVPAVRSSISRSIDDMLDVSEVDVQTVECLEMYSDMSGQEIYNHFSNSEAENYTSWARTETLDDDDLKKVRTWQETVAKDYFIDRKNEGYSNAEIVRDLEWQFNFGVSKSTVYRRIKKGLENLGSYSDSEFKPVRNMVDASKVVENLYNLPEAKNISRKLN